jgi:hypothetical protein
MPFVNLTPHPINLHLPDGSVQTFAPSGAVARAAETRTQRGTLDGVAVELVAFGAVDGLPAQAADTLLIVSGLVLAACADRPDVLAPGQPVRDDAGRVVGCKGWTCTPAFAQDATPPTTPTHPSPAMSPAMSPSYRAWGAATHVPYTPPPSPEPADVPEMATLSRLRWNGVGMDNSIPFEFRIGAATYWCDDLLGRGHWRDNKGRPMAFEPKLERGKYEDFSHYDAEARARALAFAEKYNFPPDRCEDEMPASAEKWVGEDGTVRYEKYRADGTWIIGAIRFGTYTVPVTKVTTVSDQQARQNAELMDDFISGMGMLSEKD